MPFLIKQATSFTNFSMNWPLCMKSVLHSQAWFSLLSLAHLLAIIYTSFRAYCFRSSLVLKKYLYNFSTNQTTLENTTPFMILRHLPPLPQTGHSLSDPPLEPELSYDQRKLVRDAHSHILLYDIGFRKNWAQVFGWNRKYGWLYRLWYGGSS